MVDGCASRALEVLDHDKQRTFQSAAEIKDDRTRPDLL